MFFDGIKFATRFFGLAVQDAARHSLLRRGPGDHDAGTVDIESYSPQPLRLLAVRKR
jgi:hypothetical protein